MTNIVRIKNKKCIVWTVQTSGSSATYGSKGFFLQDHRCYLQLSVDFYSGGCFNSSLYCKSIREPQLPIKAILHVTKAFATLSVKTISVTTTNNEIWKCVGTQKNSLLTFQLFILVDPRKDDKSVQTPSYISKCILVDAVSRDFSKLLVEDPNHDVEFTCGDQTFKAHKSILSCRSSVFASMFQTDMVEGKTGRVNIVDMDATIFDQFLKYLYTGVLPELKFPEALQFYSAGDKYNICVLKKQCAEFLIDILSPENACNILIVADLHNDADFKKSIMKYMMEEKIPYMGEKWEDFCKENLMLANEVLNLFCRHLRRKKTRFFI